MLPPVLNECCLQNVYKILTVMLLGCFVMFLCSFIYISIKRVFFCVFFLQHRYNKIMKQCGNIYDATCFVFVFFLVLNYIINSHPASDLLFVCLFAVVFYFILCWQKNSMMHTFVHGRCSLHYRTKLCKRSLPSRTNHHFTPGLGSCSTEKEQPNQK